MMPTNFIDFIAKATVQTPMSICNFTAIWMRRSLIYSTAWRRNGNALWLLRLWVSFASQLRLTSKRICQESWMSSDLHCLQRNLRKSKTIPCISCPQDPVPFMLSQNDLLILSRESCRKNRIYTVDPSVFTCISMLAKAVGPAITDDIKLLIEPILAVRLRYHFLSCFLPAHSLSLIETETRKTCALTIMNFLMTQN